MASLAARRFRGLSKDAPYPSSIDATSATSSVVRYKLAWTKAEKALRLRASEHDGRRRLTILMGAGSCRSAAE